MSLGERMGNLSLDSGGSRSSLFQPSRGHKLSIEYLKQHNSSASSPDTRPPESQRPSTAVSELGYGAGTETAPFQPHKRILGWKLTSQARRKQMIHILESARMRPASQASTYRYDEQAWNPSQGSSGSGSQASMEESLTNDRRVAAIETSLR